MHPSYRQLIDDHERIEQSARQLLAAVRDENSEAATLGSQLNALALTIGEHIVIEDAVIAQVDDVPKAGPWVDTWIEGVASFQRLKSDWVAFLNHWNTAAIAQDRPGFQAQAEAIFARLSERLQDETRAFYSTALQHGGIALR